MSEDDAATSNTAQLETESAAQYTPKMRIAPARAWPPDPISLGHVRYVSGILQVTPTRSDALRGASPSLVFGHDASLRRLPTHPHPLSHELVQERVKLLNTAATGFTISWTTIRPGKDNFFRANLVTLTSPDGTKVGVTSTRALLRAINRHGAAPEASKRDTNT